MDLKISPRRLKELERMESKLNALESGGVDNWDFYDDSLKTYHLENEKEERIDALIADLEIAFAECAYERSERGAGIAFDDGVEASIVEIFTQHKVTFSDLGEDDD